jgi:intein/homing endonuclease
MAHTAWRKSIEKPGRSEALAEFTGILLGDGGISKYQLAITLNIHEERGYGAFVIALIENLFGVTPSVHYEKNAAAFNIVVSRRDLVVFCNDVLGLAVGDKIRQKIDLPGWIKKDKSFAAASMRGLFDTDGSVFDHRYHVGGKLYSYKKFEFCSLSRPLLDSVHMILKNLDLHPRFSRGKSIWLDSRADVKRYFDTIGSHNPKHLKRYSPVI